MTPPREPLGLAITEREGAFRFAVRIQPRASRSGIEGVHGDALRVRLTAPPVEGAANEALVELLAGALEIPRRAVRLVAGTAGRTKIVEVAGVSAASLARLAHGNGER